MTVEITDFVTFQGVSVRQDGSAFVASYTFNYAYYDLFCEQNEEEVKLYTFMGLYTNHRTSYGDLSPVIDSSIVRIDLIITDLDKLTMEQLGTLDFVLSVAVKVGDTYNYVVNDTAASTEKATGVVADPFAENVGHWNLATEVEKHNNKAN